MTWEENDSWLVGDDTASFYRHLLEDAREKPFKDKSKKMNVKPEEMPWELAPQGILKHLINSEMNTRLETVDIYMQVIPPGSRSGKHRHLAEEYLYVLEGSGYDVHRDCDVEITDSYHWIPVDEEKKFEWKAGDVIYIPPNTIHQHFNANEREPARLVSAINRIYKNSGLNDLEQIENAPEYAENTKIDAAKVKELISGR